MKLPTIIAGPCSMESLENMMQVASKASKICEELGFEYVFKSSFLKANRSSHHSYTGPGLQQGRAWLKAVSEELGLRTTSDVHEVAQVEPASEVIDIIQIPALLSRQTPLLLAAGQTGKSVNLKRGQFMAPWHLSNAVDKLRHSGASEIIVTERGTMNGYEDLIVDLRTLVEARSLGVKAGFDGTHTTQQPVSMGTQSGGNPNLVPAYVRAAVAVGVDYIFLETHPNPTQALSDGECMLPLSKFRLVLEQVRELSALNF